MIIRGILDRSLGNIICIRGFARLSDLEKISKPNDLYQRDLIIEHKNEIKKYLKKREYLFFPEVILSYTVNNEIDNIDLKADYEEIINFNSAKSKSLKFSNFVRKYSGENDSRSVDRVNLITIDIDDSYIVENKLFNRIDGNHRLSAAKDLDSYDSNLSTPFCIILLRNDETDIKFESIIFHDINSKGRHLTSEENLKAILDGDLFSEKEILEKFSWSYVKAKELIRRIDFDYLNALKNSFINVHDRTKLHQRTVAVLLLEFLKKRKVIQKNVSIDKLIGKLNFVNSLYSESIELSLSNDPGLLTAFLYYCFKDDNENNHQVLAFKNWVLKNKINNINNIDTESIVDVFDKILEHQIKIFMAMPYYSDPEVDAYNKILQRSIDSIKSHNKHLNLTMFPIMREEGASMDIVMNLLNNIKNCQIFIADISINNENVFFEYGYAKGMDKQIIVVKKADDATKMPFDIEHNLRFKFDSHTQLEELLIERIKQIIIQMGYIIN